MELEECEVDAYREAANCVAMLSNSPVDLREFGASNDPAPIHKFGADDVTGGAENVSEGRKGSSVA